MTKCNMPVSRRQQGVFFFRNCHLKATVERDGKWFCPRHDPERLAMEREKRNREAEEECAKIQALYEAKQAKKARRKAPHA